MRVMKFVLGFLHAAFLVLCSGCVTTHNGATSAIDEGLSVSCSRDPDFSTDLYIVVGCTFENTTRSALPVKIVSISMKPSNADQRRGFVPPHTVTAEEEQAHFTAIEQQIRRRGQGLLVWSPILTAVTLAVVASNSSGATAPEIGAASFAGGIHAVSINSNTASYDRSRPVNLYDFYSENRIVGSAFVIAAEGTTVRYETYRLNESSDDRAPKLPSVFALCLEHPNKQCVDVPSGYTNPIPNRAGPGR